MNALYLVLPLALVIATTAVIAFVWSVRSGQLDDLDTPPHRILVDDGDHAECAPPAQIPAHRASTLTDSEQIHPVASSSGWHEL